MRSAQTRNPGWRAGASRTHASGRGFHVDTASAEPLLQRLEGVAKAGKGWRARCPACEGRSRKLSIAESDGRVLIYCFAGCKAIEVLEAVGLGWPDVMPPRHWPDTPEERRRARRAIREAGWASALSVLTLEAKIIQLAAHELATVGGLEPVDITRLDQAVERVDHCANVLVEAPR